MNWKVIGLFAIAAMMTALLIELKPASDQDSDRRLLPGLADKLDDVSMIVMSKGADQVTLTPDAAGRWGVEEKSGYRADTAELSRLLSQLARLQWREEKTARPENHARLGLSLDAGTSPVRVVITVGETDLDLLVGLSADAGGSYVRLPDQNQVYLTAQTLDVPVDSIDWIDPVLINVDSSQVVRVQMQQGDDELVAVRSGEGDLKLQNLPAGAELSHPTIADGLSRLLVNLRFEDVQPYNSQVFAGASETTIELASGEVLTVSTVEVEGDHWLHVDRTGLGDWQYKVPDYTYHAFNKTIQDMVKPNDPT